MKYKSKGNAHELAEITIPKEKKKSTIQCLYGHTTSHLRGDKVKHKNEEVD